MRGTTVLALCVALVVMSIGSASAYSFIGLGAGRATGVTGDGSAVAWNGSGNINLWTSGSGSSVIGAGTSAGVAKMGTQVVVAGNRTGVATPSYYLGGSWTDVAAPAGYTTWRANNIGASANNIYIAGTNPYDTNNWGAVGFSLTDGVAKFDHNAFGPGHDRSNAWAVSDSGMYVGDARFGGSGATGGGLMGTYGGPNPVGADWNWLKTAIDPYTPNYSEEVAAFAVSRDGQQAAGWAYAASGAWQAVRWVASPALGSGQAILVPLITADWSEAHAISNSGRVGGWYYNVGYTVQSAFIWDSVNGSRDVKSILTANGVNMTGWTLTSVTGISDDGNTLVGYGKYNGVESAWVANVAVPEPASMSILLVGLAGLIARRKRS